jgi:peptidoglycan hydrolase-like protein with peptidoglycan-binding domain
MKITQTVAALSALATLIAGPTVFAEQHQGADTQSGGAQQGQGAPSAGGGETSGGTSSGAMGGSMSGGAQALSSDQVRQVQQALKDKGHDVGAIDGQWGPKTQNALKEYQQAQGMSASGELDSQTLSSLGVSGSAVGSPGAGEQPSPEAGGAPGGGGASEDVSPGAGTPTPTPDAGGAPSGGGTGEDAGPGAATGGRGY